MTGDAMSYVFQPLEGETQQTAQYSLHDFSIPTRGQRQPRPVVHYQTAAFSSQHSGSSSQDWVTGQQDKRHDAVNAFDTEMSGVASGGHSSTGATPSNSHAASSNTSNSPLSDRDPNPACETQPSKTAYSAASSTPYTFFVQPRDNQLTPPSEPEFATLPAEPQQRDQQQDDGSFTLLPEWHLESTTSETPNPTAGMTPLGDGGWAQMLEGMGWNGGALGTEGLAWTAPTESIT